MFLFYVCVKHPLLLEVVRHGVLRQKWRLELDFGSDPFAFGMGSIRRMVAASTAAELGTEVRALNLIELADLAPGGVAAAPAQVLRAVFTQVGRTLMAASFKNDAACMKCHTINSEGGKVGPDLDILKPPRSLVLHTIANGCLPNASGSNQNESCLGQGVMPSEVVTGKDAQDVASFVAEAAGH